MMVGARDHHFHCKRPSVPGCFITTLSYASVTASLVQKHDGEAESFLE